MCVCGRYDCVCMSMVCVCVHADMTVSVCKGSTFYMYVAWSWMSLVSFPELDVSPSSLSLSPPVVFCRICASRHGLIWSCCKISRLPAASVE